MYTLAGFDLKRILVARTLMKHRGKVFAWALFKKTADPTEKSFSGSTGKDATDDDGDGDGDDVRLRRRRREGLVSRLPVVQLESNL
jgi:hypothetical protein